MERPLKQRLVGGAILVALVVIFLPMILYGPGEGGSLFGGPSVPPKPDWALAPPRGATGPAQVTPPAPAPAGPVIVGGPSGASPESSAPGSVDRKPIAPGARTPTSGAASGASLPAVAQHPSAVPGLHAWVVQLASLSRESNAVALRDRLRRAGFAAFVERVRVNGKPVFRVRVGPELDRDRAEALRRRLQQTRNLHGIVLAYP